MIHAAARGRTSDLAWLVAPPHLEDLIDFCHVKDAARAIAMLQLAPELRHRTYNVSSGRATSNLEVFVAIRAAVPNAEVDLPPGGQGTPSRLDITRLQDDTGYEPAYDTERAAADCPVWLRSGNEL